MRWTNYYIQIFDALVQITRSPNSESSPTLYSQLLFGTQELELLGPVFNPSFHAKDDRAQVGKKIIAEGSTQQNVSAHTAEQARFLSDLVDISIDSALRIVCTATNISHQYEGWSIPRLSTYIYHSELASALNVALLILSNYSLPEVPEWLVSLTDAYFSQILEKAGGDSGHILKAIERCQRLSNQAQFCRSNRPDNTQDKNDLELVKLFHAESCDKVACLLSLVLFFVSFTFGLNVEEVLAILVQLRNCESYEDFHIVMAASVMATLFPVTISKAIAKCSISHRFELTEHNITRLCNLIVRSPWKNEDLHGVIMTQWQCYLNSLMYIEYIDDDIDHELKSHISSILSDVTRSWKSHVINYPGTFSFLTDYILHFRRVKSELPQNVKPISKKISLHISNHLLQICDGIVNGLVLLKRELKEIRNHGENQIFSLNEHDVSQDWNFGFHPAITWQTLTKFVIILYRDRPDAALGFWRNSELNATTQKSQQVEALYLNAKQAFIKTSADLSTSVFINMFMQLLATLATGAECAKEVHLRLISDSPNNQFGKVTWSLLFPAFNGIVDALSCESYESMLPSEENLVKSFLKMISQIAKYYPIHKWALYDNTNHKILRVIFSLLLSSNSVHMKAAAFDTISSICIPMNKDYELQYQVWLFIEDSKLVPISVPRAANPGNNTNLNIHYQGGTTLRILEGISHDFEEIESHIQIYPETVAFLNLINVLLKGGKYHTAVGTIRGIGLGSRLPGLRPYIQFIRDAIYLNVHLRNFSNDGQKWEIIYHCMEIFDRSLSLFVAEANKLNTYIQDLNTSEKGSIKDNLRKTNGHTSLDLITNAKDLALEPGFEVLIHILSSSLFLQRLFAMLKQACMENESGKEISPYFYNAIHAVLRMFVRVLQIQKWLHEYYIPILSEASLADYLVIPKTMSTLEKHFAINQETVLSLILLLDMEHHEIAYLSLKVLTLISKTSIFAEVDAYSNLDRLASIVIDSGQEDKVVNAFVNRLTDEESESYEYIGYDPGDSFLDIVLSERTNDTLRVMQSEIKEVEICSRNGVGMIHLIRSTILDLFLSSVKSGNSWTLAHHILGYELLENTLEYNPSLPTPSSGRLNCLNIIVSRLQDSIECRKSPNSNDFVNYSMANMLEPKPFMLTHPCLAVRCYELLHTLCESRVTATPTLRYLRTSGNFFFPQMRNILNICPDVDYSSFLENGSPYIALIFCKSWLMKLVALEIYNESSPLKGVSRVEDIVSFLLIPPVKNTSSKELETGLLHNGANQVQSGTKFERPLAAIIEILSSLSFVSTPSSCELPNISDTIFSSIDLTNYAGDMFGIGELTTAMNKVIRKQTQDPSRYFAQRDEILRKIFCANIACKVLAARTSCALSWGRLMEVTIHKGLDYVPAEIRGEGLLQCLSALLEKILIQDTIHSISESMALVILSLMDRIGAEVQFGPLISGMPVTEIEDILDISITNSNDGVTWRSIIYNLINLISSPNASQDMRSILYCAFLVILQCAQHSVLSSSTPRVNKSTRDLLYSIIALEPHICNLVPIVSKDSLFGPKHWRAISYSLLDSMIWLSSIGSRSEYSERGRCHVVEKLAISGFASLFIQSIYKEDNNSLNDLFNNINESNFYSKLAYDMKMCMLLRLSQSHYSCKLIVKCNLIETLTECTFMSMEPEVPPKGKNPGTDKSARLSCYNEAFISAMMLINSVYETSSSNTNLPQKILSFALSKKDQFNSILKFSSVTSPLPNLEKLEVTLCMYAHLAQSGLFFDEEALSENLEISKILILNLASKFFEYRKLDRSKLGDQVPDSEPIEHRCSLINLINTHIMRFWLSILSPPKSFHDTSNSVLGYALFSSFFLDSVNKESLTYPTMGITCSMLTSLLKDFQDTQSSYTKLLASREEFYPMVADYMGGSSDGKYKSFSVLTEDQKRYVSTWKINEVIESKKMHISYIFVSMEMLIFIIWKYLKWYERLSDPYETEVLFPSDFPSKQEHLSQTSSMLSPTLCKIVSDDFKICNELTECSIARVTILQPLASKILEILNKEKSSN